MIATMNTEIPVRAKETHHHVLPKFLDIPYELTEHKDDEEATRRASVNNHFRLFEDWKGY